MGVGYVAAGGVVFGEVDVLFVFFIRFRHFFGLALAGVCLVARWRLPWTGFNGFVLRDRTVSPGPETTERIYYAVSQTVGSGP